MATEMMYLEDYLVNRPIEDTRKFLRGIYKGAYEAGAYDPFNSVNTWNWFIKYHKGTFNRALEIGCGLGAGILLARKCGFNIWGVDFAFIPRLWKKFKVQNYCFAAEARCLPFKDASFDMVMMPDVLEHIPEFDVLEVLQEMRRVGSKDYYVLVDLGYESKPINDRLYTHITVREEQWWRDMVSKAGFFIKKIDKFIDGKEDNKLIKVGYAMEKYQPATPWQIEVGTFKAERRIAGSA